METSNKKKCVFIDVGETWKTQISELGVRNHTPYDMFLYTYTCVTWIIQIIYKIGRKKGWPYKHWDVNIHVKVLDLSWEDSSPYHTPINNSTRAPVTYSYYFTRIYTGLTVSLPCLFIILYCVMLFSYVYMHDLKFLIYTGSDPE